MRVRPRTFEDRQRDRAESAWTMLITRSPGVDLSPSGYGSLKPTDIAAALQGLERPQFLMGMAAIAGDLSTLHELADHVERIVVRWAVRHNWGAKVPATYRKLAELALFELLGGKRCIVCHGSQWFVPDLDDRSELARKGRRYLSEHVQEQIKAAIRIRDQAVALRRKLRKEQRAAESQLEIPRKTRKHLADLQREVQALERSARAIGGARKCEECAGTGRLKLEDRHRAMVVGLSTDHWWHVWSHRHWKLMNLLNWWIEDCLEHVAKRLRNIAA